VERQTQNLHAWWTTNAPNIFQKKYNSETTIDEEGFQVYKRRENGKQIKKGKLH